jgi:hypothetical protein
MDLAIIWWCVETIFFQIRDGWHWDALCHAEQVCDNVVNILIVIDILCFIRIRDLIEE